MASESGERLSKARLERLTDGVFAIVMTILVLEITDRSLDYLSFT